MKNYKIIDVTFEALEALEKTNLFVLSIPCSTKATAIWWDFEGQCFCVRIEHPSFDSVLEGVMTPRIEIELRPSATDSDPFVESLQCLWRNIKKYIPVPELS